MESVCESSVQAMISHCETTLADIRADLESVKTQIDRIGGLKLRVAQVTFVGRSGRHRRRHKSPLRFSPWPIGTANWRIRWTKWTEISNRDAR
jgi:hypothetical protein